MKYFKSLSKTLSTFLLFTDPLISREAVVSFIGNTKINKDLKVITVLSDVRIKSPIS